jgi:hypothetical protein
MIERSSDTVCSLHHAQGDEERGFLGLALKPRSTVSPSLGLKIGSCGLVIWPTKSTRWFPGLGLKPKWEEVCRFAPQNRCVDEDGMRTRINIRRLASLGSKSG